eukprot:1158855-Pelagomonas_calceolata.AAC.3
MRQLALLNTHLHSTSYCLPTSTSQLQTLMMRRLDTSSLKPPQLITSEAALSPFKPAAQIPASSVDLGGAASASLPLTLPLISAPLAAAVLLLLLLLLLLVRR